MLKETQISRKAGFTLVEIMIVVAIIGLLAAIAIPNFVRARVTSQADTCINNLRQIDSAKQQWALENNQTAAATPGAAVLAIYLGRGSSGSTINVGGGQVQGQINCPSSGTYTINDVQTKPSCSIARTTTPFHELPL
jgi:prepilin-type N-terminal cleavage/methylation domain-containing protein